MPKKNSFLFLKELETKKRSEETSIANSYEFTFLCILIQGEKYYIKADSVGEVLPYQPPSPVGHTAPWFDGILKVQDEIYAVLDISNFLGYEALNKKKKFIVALSKGNDNIAIIVDEALGVYNINTNTKLVERGVIDTYKINDEMFSIISLNRLLSSNNFKNISIF